MNGKAFTEEEIRTINRLAPSHTVSEIAKKLHRPASSVHNAIACRSLSAAKTRYRQVKTSDIKLISELSKQGLTGKQMAAITNFPAWRCNYIRAKYL